MAAEAPAFAPADFGALVQALTHPASLPQAGVLLGCLLLAWLLTWLLARSTGAAGRGSGRGGETSGPAVEGLWFGRRLIDGALFPLLALALVFAARSAGGEGLGSLLLRVAVPVLLSLSVIRLAVRVLQQVFPHSAGVRLAERLLSWLVWLVVVLWVTGVLPRVVEELDALRWKMGGADVSLWSLLEGGMNAAVVLLLALWLSSAIESHLLAGPSREAPGGVDGASLSLRKIAANGTRALLVFVGLLLALSAAGIPIGALGVLGGAVGVGIGFGLQRLAANYVSGFVILAERSLRIGDTVRVDGFEGRITDIHSRYTVIRALNGRESIVPNELLITQRVENASLADPRILLTASVQVAYGTDLQALAPRLVAAVRAVPRVVADPPPAVQLTAFASDGLQLAVPFWIADPENGQGNVASDVNLAILAVLADMGVEIPFPQRVVRQTG